MESHKLHSTSSITVPYLGLRKKIDLAYSNEATLHWLKQLEDVTRPTDSHARRRIGVNIRGSGADVPFSIFSAPTPHRIFQPSHNF